MRKILVSDYDNTFFRNDKEIKENMLKVEEFRRKNNLFIIATGRSYYDFNRALKEYDIKYDYLIINQGATILNNKNNIIENHTIDEKVKDMIAEDLKLNDEETMFACSALESRVSIKNEKITKIHKGYENIDIARKMNEFINNKYSSSVNSYLITTSNSIEIISSMTNKAKAISKIAEIENIDKQNVFTIGDSYNDIEMIKSFNGFCVENAQQEVKDVSIKVCSSVSGLINELQC